MELGERRGISGGAAFVMICLAGVAGYFGGAYHEARETKESSSTQPVTTQVVQPTTQQPSTAVVAATAPAELAPEVAPAARVAEQPPQQAQVAVFEARPSETPPAVTQTVVASTPVATPKVTKITNRQKLRWPLEPGIYDIRGAPKDKLIEALGSELLPEGKGPRDLVADYVGPNGEEADFDATEICNQDDGKKDLYLPQIEKMPGSEEKVARQANLCRWVKADETN